MGSMATMPNWWARLMLVDWVLILVLAAVHGMIEMIASSRPRYNACIDALG